MAKTRIPKKNRVQKIHQHHTRSKCIACNGSGYYDHNGSPRCGSCGGTGKTK